MASLEKDLEEQVTCSVCLETFNNPRVLPCLHTYCKECLENLATKSGQRNKIICPECRAEIEISAGDVAKLKVNFWINNLLSILSLRSAGNNKTEPPKVVCEMCESDSPAAGRCAECGVFMCEFCITAHKRQRATKMHSIASLDEIGTADALPNMKKPSFCSHHQGEVLKLFCETCDELICRDCTIIDHRDHKYQFTVDVIEREKQNIQSKILDATKVTSSLEATLALVKEEQRRLEAQKESAATEVDTLIDTQNLRLNLKDKIQAVHGTKTKQLTAQEDELSLKLAGVRSSVDFAVRVCSEGSDTDVLLIKNEVVSRLTQLSKEPLDDSPCVTGDLKVVVDHDALGSIAKSVDIDDCIVDPKMCTVTMGIGGEPGVIYTTFADQTYEFIITIRGRSGKMLTRCLSKVEVSVCNMDDRSEEPEIRSVHVQYVEDGTYQATYQPLSKGSHLVSITVGGRHILGSPLTWMVKEKVDIATFRQTPLLQEEDGISWKVKLVNVGNIEYTFLAGENSPPPREPLIGVVASDGKVWWYWCAGKKYFPDAARFHHVYSRSKSGGQHRRRIPDITSQPSEITSWEKGVVFTVYLVKQDQSAKMTICNSSTGQASVFPNICIPVFPHFNPSGYFNNSLFEYEFIV